MDWSSPLMHRSPWWPVCLQAAINAARAANDEEQQHAYCTEQARRATLFEGFALLRSAFESA